MMLAVNAVVTFSFLYVGRIIESNLYVVRCTFVISLMNSDSLVMLQSCVLTPGLFLVE